MGGDTDRFKALVAGVVDATVVSSEYVPVAAKNGVHLMVSAREVLPEYKVPSDVVFDLGPLPRTASGKVIKRQLRERYPNYTTGG